MKRGFRVAFLLLASVAFGKQRHHLPPQAPLPDQVLRAKSVFLLSKTEAIFYDQAYKRLKEWGRFQLVNDPEKADVILVLTTERSYLGSTVHQGEYSGATIARYSQNLRLVILDPRTKLEVWTEERPRRLALREKNREKEKMLAVDDL